MKPKTTSLLSMVAVLCGTAAFADNGNGGGQNGAVFSSGIVGSMPNQSIAGVKSGGAPWVVREGSARLLKNGKLKVEVEGLLIAAGTLANGNPVPPGLVGTTGPVTMVAASLICDGVVAGSTPVAALSAAGDAELEGKLSVSSCGTPAVLVRIATSMSATSDQLGPFIAMSGSSLSGDDHGGK